MLNFRDMNDAPDDQQVLLDFGNDNYAVAIWYFGAWGSTYPVLGEPFPAEPVRWAPLQKRLER